MSKSVPRSPHAIWPRPAPRWRTWWITRARCRRLRTWRSRTSPTGPPSTWRRTGACGGWPSRTRTRKGSGLHRSCSASIRPTRKPRAASAPCSARASRRSSARSPTSFSCKGHKDERHLHLIRSLGLKSYICVPLVVAGKTLGVLTFATAESGRRYTEADLDLAMDLAHRAAVAIENTQLYQALREADRRKDEFLATLAHELRNPLAPIRNSLQILKMPRVDAETVERSRNMMERQVQHLVRLVDDLLDVSRVMRGKIELRRERVELATIVARAVETVQPLVDSQAHELSVRLPRESLPVDADPVRLAQVVGNLLTNAAKYTEPNGRIWLTAERDGRMAVLRVRDNGIGITPEMLPRIFELFVQVDHAATRSQGGLGIGLTLVKNLVEMHNGTVEARSEGLGKGSEFLVRLPISAQGLDQDRGEEEGRQEHQRPSPSGYRLLVVDDNQDAADSLADDAPAARPRGPCGVQRYGGAGNDESLCAGRGIPGHRDAGDGRLRGRSPNAAAARSGESGAGGTDRLGAAGRPPPHGGSRVRSPPRQAAGAKGSGQRACPVETAGSSRVMGPPGSTAPHLARLST